MAHNPPFSAGQLTRQLAAGDASAIAHFYAEYFDFMLHEAYRVTHRDEHFCLDIVQESMLRVIRKIPPIETQSQLDAWTRRLVCTVAYDQLRSELRRRQREVRRLNRQRNENAVTSQVEAEKTQDRLAWLAAHLRSLDERDLRLLSARFGAGLTLREIGRNRGMSAGAVDGRIRRILTKLRKLLLESPE